MRETMNEIKNDVENLKWFIKQQREGLEKSLKEFPGNEVMKDWESRIESMQRILDLAQSYLKLSESGVGKKDDSYPIRGPINAMQRSKAEGFNQAIDAQNLLIAGRLAGLEELIKSKHIMVEGQCDTDTFVVVPIKELANAIRAKVEGIE